MQIAGLFNLYRLALGHKEAFAVTLRPFFVADCWRSFLTAFFNCTAKNAVFSLHLLPAQPINCYPTQGLFFIINPAFPTA